MCRDGPSRETNRFPLLLGLFWAQRRHRYLRRAVKGFLERLRGCSWAPSSVGLVVFAFLMSRFVAATGAGERKEQVGSIN